MEFYSDGCWWVETSEGDSYYRPDLVLYAMARFEAPGVKWAKLYQQMGGGIDFGWWKLLEERSTSDDSSSAKSSSPSPTWSTQASALPA